MNTGKRGSQMATKLAVEYTAPGLQSGAWWDGVLGVAGFGDESFPAVDPAIPFVRLHMPLLNREAAKWEVWQTCNPLRSGRHSRVHYRRSEHILFGAISIDESEVDGSLAMATALAYGEVFGTLEAQDCPHLLRIWNYLPSIHGQEHGLERYWQFNNARRQALAASGRDISGAVPAACALGSIPGSPLTVYFLAARDNTTPIENPRQISAYHYPPQYGPNPAFSRAGLLATGDDALLFISGTSSIVGHETRHAGDVSAQIRETLVNIEALLRQANHIRGNDRGFDMQRLAYKVYLRNTNDLALIQSQLRAFLGELPPAVYLQAEICRKDLGVEIEAVAREWADLSSRRPGKDSVDTIQTPQPDPPGAQPRRE
jgi:chorismate lyase / 3-hydroxybenzoate synthase